MRALHSIPQENIGPTISESTKRGISNFLTYWQDWPQSPSIRVAENGVVYYKNREDNYWFQFANIENWNPENFWGPEITSAHTWRDDMFSWAWDKIEVVPASYTGGRE